MQRKSNGCVWYCTSCLPRSSSTCFLFLLLLLSSQSHRRQRYLVSRGVIMMMGFGAASNGEGDCKVAKYEESMKAINNDAWETLAMQQELLYLDMYES
ncbi:unnamed protein product [Brassica rapa subsp. narinosa]